MAEQASPRSASVGDAIPTEALSDAGGCPPEVGPDTQPAQGLEWTDWGGDNIRAERKECPGCGSTGARNLVVCIDGTSNQFSTKNTNVVELYSRLTKDERQLTFYNSGIGTYAKPSWRSLSYVRQVIDSLLDLAFAFRFERIIISAYAWLVDNYRHGDRIFLFGFSRGAYQVRALAAMINTVGLLHKGNNDQIPFAYELYAAAGDQKPRVAERPSRAWRDIRPFPERMSGLWNRLWSRESSEGLPSFPWPAVPAQTAYTQLDDDMTMQDQFKNTFSRNVHVHFVGVWDTVSSVGMGIIPSKTLPSTTDGMQSVCFFRHALALHEFRVKFLPEYVNGSAGPSMASTLAESGEPHTKEVWFTGSHSDIGGGSSTNTSLNKFGPALRWITWEAMLAGMRTLVLPDYWEPIGISESMTATWSIAECLPIRRVSYQVRDQQTGPTFTCMPHFFARRQIRPWQRIHQTVYEECAEFQQPENVLQEADAYLILRPEEVLRRGHILDDNSMKTLNHLLSSASGFKYFESLQITRYIYNIARLSYDNPAIIRQISLDLRALHVVYVTGRLRFNRGIDQKCVIDVAETTSGAFPFHMWGHAWVVSSVAFLSDTRVVSGSFDRTVRAWDVHSGSMTLEEPLRGHTSVITCISACANRGLIASTSLDKTIRLWTSDRSGTIHAGKILRDASMGHGCAVAFSPDGSHIVSGSRDGAVRLWNVATGERMGVPVRGHTDVIRSVAFSPDGKQVVSGSEDQTVRLWDFSGGALNAVSGPLDGHLDEVYAVAFSPDGHLIASGSRDKTVRLWKVDTHMPWMTMHGHTGLVASVAFAPSGGHLASGAEDWTVRIWDIRTGEPVRTLIGHSNLVKSVSFSPDGTRIASGSDDDTVRIWDFNPDRGELCDGDDVRGAPEQM